VVELVVVNPVFCFLFLMYVEYCGEYIMWHRNRRTTEERNRIVTLHGMRACLQRGLCVCVLCKCLVGSRVTAGVNSATNLSPNTKEGRVTKFGLGK
jgi:hypothetical protein